jgi:hypothetical protein
MDTIKILRTVLIALAAALVLSGCSSMGYVNPNQLSVNDIITMTKENVNKDVIIQHIKSTHSVYKLSTDDVVQLTKAGVDQDVIKAMLQTSNQKPYDYYPGAYPYWGGYYPYYPYYNYYWYDYPLFDDYFYRPYRYYGGYGDEYRGERRGGEERGEGRGGEERGGEQRGGGERRGGGDRR